MFLTKLALYNYRSYKEAVIQFPTAGLVLVVGPNNVGKSALLSGLDVVAHQNVDAVRHAASGDETARIEAVFQLTDEERIRVKVPTERLETHLFRELSIHYDEHGPQLTVCEVRVSDLQGKRRTWAFAPVKAAGGDSDLRYANVDRILASPESDDVWELTQQITGGVHSLLTQLRTGGLDEWGALLESWRGNYFHFLANRLGTTRTRNIGANDSLSPGGENLPEAMLYLNTNRHPSWDAIREVMTDVVPDLGRLETPAIGSEVSIVFNDPHLGVPINLKDAGTGVEQVLMAAYVGERQVPGSVVVVEEPESHLHPHAQRRLLRHLARWSAERLIIVSTHSTVFLDRAEGQASVWLVTRDLGASTLRPADTDLPEVLASIGVRLSDVLSAERLLVVEGPSDVDVIRAWYGEQLDRSRVQVISGQRGGDAAWHIEAFHEWIGATDTLPRTIRFLRDRDELDPSAIERLEEGGVVHVLARREIENYLLNGDAVQRVLAQRLAGSGRTERSTSTIEASMRAAADATKRAVTIKRVAQRLAPIRLMDRPTLSELVKSGADVTEFQRRVKERLPSEDVIATIERIWQETDEQLASDWEDTWRNVAPGGDILAAVFQEDGLRFDKGRDSAMLAEYVSPPEEIRALIDDLSRTTPGRMTEPL